MTSGGGVDNVRAYRVVSTVEPYHPYCTWEGPGNVLDPGINLKSNKNDGRGRVHGQKINRSGLDVCRKNEIGQGRRKVGRIHYLDRLRGVCDGGGDRLVIRNEITLHEEKRQKWREKATGIQGRPNVHQLSSYRVVPRLLVTTIRWINGCNSNSTGLCRTSTTHLPEGQHSLSSCMEMTVLTQGSYMRSGRYEVIFESINLRVLQLFCTSGMSP